MTEKTELCGRKKDACGQHKVFVVEFTVYSYLLQWIITMPRRRLQIWKQARSRQDGDLINDKQK